MSKLRVSSFAVSVDGFGAGPNQDERQRCRFLRFAVAAERDGGPISLEVTGPPGTAQFLEQLVTGA